MSQGTRIDHRGMVNEYLTCFESVSITILKALGLRDATSLLGRRGFFVAPAEGLAISPRIHPLEVEWAPYLDLVRQPVSTAAELHEGIGRALTRGRPVCLPVDLYTWRHTPHFEQRHQHHYVALFGMDEEHYHALCPYYGFEGPVSLREVESGHFSPSSTQEGLITLEPRTLEPLSPGEANAAVRESCAFMLGSTFPATLSGVDSRLLGCAGIATFAGRLESLIETPQDLTEVEGLIDLSRYLMVVGYSRHWFSRLLSIHGEHLLEDGIREHLLEVTQAWIAAGKRLAMGLHGRRPPLIVESLRRVAQLAGLERDLFTALQAALSGGGGGRPAPAPSPREAAAAPWPDRAPWIAPQTPEERRIATAFGEILGAPAVGRNDDFFQLGGDSILLIRLISRIRDDLGVTVSFRTFFEAPTVARLAARLPEAIAAIPSEAVAPPLGAASDSTSGPLPLAPSQHGCFERAFAFHHWNMPLFLEFGRAVSHGALATALGALLRHHEALRARFEQRDGRWAQFLEPLGQVPLTTIDLRALPVSRHRAVMEAVAAALQPRFDLGRAPLLRLVRFARGPHQRDRLFVLFHHLLLDGYSLGIVLGDLRRALEQVEVGETIRLPKAATSFRTWVERLSAHAASPETAAELDHWLALPWARVAPLPFDHPDGHDVRESVAEVSQRWDRAFSRRLTGTVAAALGVSAGEILLAALARALADWTGHTVQSIKTFDLGRLPHLDPELDLSRTVGFFSFSYPVVVEVAPADDPLDDVEHVAAQLRRVRHGGLGYALLRHLSPEPGTREAVKRLPAPQVRLNYRGGLGRRHEEDPLLRTSDEDPGPLMPPSHPRGASILLSGKMEGDRLQLSWEYSRHCHERSTIDALASRLDGFLRKLVAGRSVTRCAAPTPEPCAEPSGIPCAPLRSSPGSNP